MAIMGAGRHKRVMGDDSMPHAATGVFDTAGCRATSFHDARVVGGGGGAERAGHTDDTGTWRRRVVERTTRSDRGRRATGHDGATKHALGDVYGRDMRPWQH